MGPIWGRQDQGGPHVDPMNFAIWECMFVQRLNVATVVLTFGKCWVNLHCLLGCITIRHIISYQNPIYQVPALESYDWDNDPISLGIHGDVQRINASLALQLCDTWMQDHDMGKKSKCCLYGPFEFEAAILPCSSTYGTGSLLPQDKFNCFSLICNAFCSPPWL